jgi:hypothetical protein
MKGSHISINIKSHLNYDINFYGIQNQIMSITTDNASDMKKATENGFGTCFGCFAHILNLVLKNGLSF